MIQLKKGGVGQSEGGAERERESKDEIRASKRTAT